jgi:hypothetical protein
VGRNREQASQHAGEEIAQKTQQFRFAPETLHIERQRITTELAEIERREKEINAERTQLKDRKKVLLEQLMRIDGQDV